MSGVREKMTDEDKDVLRLIWESHSKPQASDIAEIMAWADDTRAAHYRSNKLADLGLVEKHKQGDSRLSPVRFGTTNLGEDIAKEISDEESEHEGIRERMDRLEDQLEAQQRTYSTVKRRIVEMEDEIDSHDADLDSIAQDVKAIQNYLED